MSDLFCENINLFWKNLINKEKNRISEIIQLIIFFKNKEKNNKREYDKIISKYENIIEEEKENTNKKIRILRKTENYILEQINALMKNNGDNYLIMELYKELENIKKIINNMLQI